MSDLTSVSELTLSVSHQGATYEVVLSANQSVRNLQEKLEELSSVPPSTQKLLYKGKKNVPDTATLEQAGFRNGLKVQMLGSTMKEIGGMQDAEAEKKRREEIMRQRTAKGPAKMRSTGSSSSSSASLNYRFHKIEPLPHLPDPASASRVLHRLASDPAIIHVMQQHQFAVGVLTELAPHEHPNLLGLNVNAGQAIKLRLRTDDYGGFRRYSDVRRVLCHELTHNVWGDHDNNFKELNSRLNKEVAEFERTKKEGAHVLGGNGDVYEPHSAIVESEAYEYVLGGQSSALGSNRGDSRDDRRRHALEAAISRLKKEEEELEQSCGTSGPSATS